MRVAVWFCVVLVCLLPIAVHSDSTPCGERSAGCDFCTAPVRLGQAGEIECQWCNDATHGTGMCIPRQVTCPSSYSTTSPPRVLGGLSTCCNTWSSCFGCASAANQCAWCQPGLDSGLTGFCATASTTGGNVCAASGTNTYAQIRSAESCIIDPCLAKNCSSTQRCVRITTSEAMCVDIPTCEDCDLETSQCSVDWTTDPANPTATCKTLCSAISCPSSTTCEVVSGVATCVGTSTTTCGSFSECSTCLSASLSTGSCGWCPPTGTQQGHCVGLTTTGGTSTGTCGTSTSIVLGGADQCSASADPCVGVTCNLGHFCRLGTCHSNCELLSCPAGQYCGIADFSTDTIALGQAYCQGEATTNTVTQCSSRTGCAACLAGVTVGTTTTRPCGYCISTAGAFCVNKTGTTESNRCGSDATTASNFIPLPAYCPVDGCASKTCDFGYKCVTQQDGTGVCRDKCTLISCSGLTTRCQINSETGNAGCVDLCATMECGEEVCRVSSAGIAYCTDACYGSCTGTSTCSSQGLCTCPEGSSLVRSVDATTNVVTFSCSTTSSTGTGGVTCDGFTCPISGQVCSLTTITVGAATGGTTVTIPSCDCPTNYALGLNSAGGHACVFNPCASKTCQTNAHCVVSTYTANSVTGTTDVGNAGVCICDSGFVLNSAGACVAVDSCDDGQVRDAVTEECVDPCDDGSSPRANQCSTGSECVSPKVLGPVSTTGVALCGYYCGPDSARIFVLDTKDCPCVETASTDATIPFRLCSCPTGQQRNPTTLECEEPDSDDCDNGFAVDPITGRCFFICPTSTVDAPVLRAFASLCPSASCILPLVADTVTKLCVAACPNGLPPNAGRCSSSCLASTSGLSRYECCIRENKTNCVASCDYGKIRVNGVCVTPCATGTIVTAAGDCSDNTCPDPLQFRYGGDCIYRCATGTMVEAISDCCESPTVADTSSGTIQCRCPDGTIKVAGVPCNHKCNPKTVRDATRCPCPAGTTMDSDYNCLCDDGTLATDGGCSTHQCSAPLVLSDTGTCTCPDGTAPDSTTGACGCDPSVNSRCPLTAANCKGKEASYAPCRCVSTDTRADGVMWNTDAACQTATAITAAFCRNNPLLAVCFCILRPNAASCLRPPYCVLNPLADSCTTSSGTATTCNLGQDGCTPEKFCSFTANAQNPKCKCVIDPSACTYTNGRCKPQSECTTEEKASISNPCCYCGTHFDAQCYTASGEMIRDLNEVNTLATVTVSTEATRGNCVPTDTVSCTPRSSDVTSGGRTVGVDVTVTKSDSSSGITDATTVAVNGPRVDIDRTVSTDGTTDVHNADDLSTGVRFVLSSVTEYEDANNNNEIDAGDVVIRTSDLTARVWTASSTTSDDDITSTVLTDADGEFTLTYVAGANEYSVGGDGDTDTGRTVPANSARFFMEVDWDWESDAAKLAFDIKLVLPAGTTGDTTSTDTGSVTTFSRPATGGGSDITVGTFDADDSARVADNSFDVVFEEPRDTSDDDTDLKRNTDDIVLTVRMHVDTLGAPDSFVYDPIIGGGNGDYNTSCDCSSSTGGGLIIESSTGTGSTTGTDTGSDTGSDTSSDTSSTTGATQSTGSDVTSTGSTDGGDTSTGASTSTGSSSRSSTGSSTSTGTGGLSAATSQASVSFSIMVAVIVAVVASIF